MSSDDAQYHITAEGLARLEAELEELETKGRAEMAERIKTARDFGDLKENAEYHDAKNSQAHLETQILRLRDRTRNAVVVESAAGASKAALGSTVTVVDVESGKESVYELVTPTEANPREGKVSFDSPLAHALTGAGVGDTVSFEAPRGTRRMKITALA